MSSMFWLRWIHHFLSSIGNVDLWAIGSSDSVFQDYKLEKGRWTDPFLVVFPGKTTDNHSLGVENTYIPYTVSQSKGEVCPLYSYFTFISLKKKKSSVVPYFIHHLVIFGKGGVVLLGDGCQTSLLNQFITVPLYLMVSLHPSACWGTNSTAFILEWPPLHRVWSWKSRYQNNLMDRLNSEQIGSFSLWVWFLYVTTTIGHQERRRSRSRLDAICPWETTAIPRDAWL